MGRNGRKCPAKTETIRQKDVSAFHTKFLPIIILTKHDVTNRRLYGRNQCISGIPAGSADMPTTALYEFLHLFVLRRIIFLHPSIFDRTFKIKDVFRILLQQKQILTDRVPYIILDCGLDIPVPLCVQMCIRHHVGFRFLRLSTILSIGTATH